MLLLLLWALPKLLLRLGGSLKAKAVGHDARLAFRAVNLSTDAFDLRTTAPLVTIVTGLCSISGCSSPLDETGKTGCGTIWSGVSSVLTLQLLREHASSFALERATSDVPFEPYPLEQTLSTCGPFSSGCTCNRLSLSPGSISASSSI